MPWWVLNVFVDMVEKEILSQKNYQAKIFTTFSDKKFLEVEGRKIEIITALPSFINNIFLFFSTRNIFILSSIFDYRNLMFFYKTLMKILSKKIVKYNAPKVVISSFAIAKNLEFCSIWYKWIYNPITSLYLHSPMQYIRSHHKEYLQKLKWYKLKIFKAITSKLQKWDKQYVKYDKVYANSQYTADLAQKIYNIKAKVSYPKVEEEFLNLIPTDQSHNYYIYVWRLVKFVKELDKIIKLFNETWDPLLIMWTWPDEKYLKSISKWNIIFIWWIQDSKEKAKIIKNALWLINITKESFGLWTVEALLSWVPVFALNEWASVELIDEDSWVLVPDKKHKTLVEYFDKFKNKYWDKEYIIKSINQKLSNK